MLYWLQAKDIVASTIGRKAKTPSAATLGVFYSIFRAGDLFLRLAAA